MVPAVSTPQNLTLEEFLARSETKPASEFMDQKIIQKPMPQGKHSIIQGELVPVINQVVKTQKVARAFPELRCTFAGRSIVPDVAVVQWEHIPRDENGEIANQFLIAPDWIIEILSPHQSHTQVVKKILLCLQHGCQMGWLIDPSERTLFVYPLKQETNVFDVADNVVLPVPEFVRGLELTVQAMFDWLR